MRRDLRACGLVLCFLGASIAQAKKTPADGKELSSSGRVNLELAQSYLQANDLETALNRANRALKYDPESGDVHAMLGLIYGRIGDAERAASEYEQAVKLAPADGPILNAYGAWQCERGQFDQAEASFQRALKDPFYKRPEQTYYNAGRCAFVGGRLSEAEAYLRQAVERMPVDAGVLLLIAKVEFKLGKYLEARAFVQRCDALGPNPEVLDLAARIEDAAGNPKAATDYRSRLAGQFPSHDMSNGEGSARP